MRALYVIDSLRGGGAEQSLVDVLPSLAERGCDTEVVVLQRDDGCLRRSLSNIDVPLHDLGDMSALAQVRAIRGLTHSVQPDLVHTTLLRADILGRLACPFLTAPIVTTLPNDSYGPEHRRGSKHGPLGVAAAQAVDAATARVVRRFHAIAESVALVMSRRLMIPRAHIDVVPRGRDRSRLGTRSAARRAATRAALGIDPDTPLILVAARLDPQKGVDVAVRAMQHVRAAIPDALLAVAGQPGNLADEGAVALGRDVPGVMMLGHRHDVPDLMCAADVLACPSRWEGLGGVTLEAMALELPIVASDIAPFREAVGVAAAAFVPAGDEQALAGALVAALRDRAAADRAARAGRARFESRFTVDVAADGMAQFYRRALGQALAS